MTHVLTVVALLAVSACESGATPETRFTASADGTRLAYDVTGRGPVVLLLHGGGQTRVPWHDLGYVKRLATEFTVVTMDMRGHGESGKPEDPRAYGIDRLIEDVLAVVDAAGAPPRFAIWGFSYGANVGRYVALRSKRVQSMVYIGIPFGAATDGTFRTFILDMRAKWAPIVEAYRKGRLDVQTLSEADRATWQRGTVPVSLAWLSAMLDYPPVEPSEMPCPTLWLAGTANQIAMSSVTTYKPKLEGTRVSVSLLEGLTHPQEIERIDQTLPRALEFTRANR
jgi:pimeloyl-ACP methyl ester carboxylesterase